MDYYEELKRALGRPPTKEERLDFIARLGDEGADREAFNRSVRDLSDEGSFKRVLGRYEEEVSEKKKAEKAKADRWKNLRASISIWYGRNRTDIHGMLGFLAIIGVFVGLVCLLIYIHPDPDPAKEAADRQVQEAKDKETSEIAQRVLSLFAEDDGWEKSDPDRWTTVWKHAKSGICVMVKSNRDVYLEKPYKREFSTEDSTAIRIAIDKMYAERIRKAISKAQPAQ